MTCYKNQWQTRTGCEPIFDTNMVGINPVKSKIQNDYQRYSEKMHNDTLTVDKPVFQDELMSEFPQPQYAQQALNLRNNGIRYEDYAENAEVFLQDQRVEPNPQFYNVWAVNQAYERIPYERQLQSEDGVTTRSDYRPTSWLDVLMYRMGMDYYNKIMPYNICDADLEGYRQMGVTGVFPYSGCKLADVESPYEECVVFRDEYGIKDQHSLPNFSMARYIQTKNSNSQFEQPKYLDMTSYGEEYRMEKEQQAFGGNNKNINTSNGKIQIRDYKDHQQLQQETFNNYDIFQNGSRQAKQNVTTQRPDQYLSTYKDNEEQQVNNDNRAGISQYIKQDNSRFYVEQSGQDGALSIINRGGQKEKFSTLNADDMDIDQRQIEESMQEQQHRINSKIIPGHNFLMSHTSREQLEKDDELSNEIKTYLNPNKIQTANKNLYGDLQLQQDGVIPIRQNNHRGPINADYLQTVKSDMNDQANKDEFVLTGQNVINPQSIDLGKARQQLQSTNVYNNEQMTNNRYTRPSIYQGDASIGIQKTGDTLMTERLKEIANVISDPTVMDTKIRTLNNANPNPNRLIQTQMMQDRQRSQQDNMINMERKAFSITTDLVDKQFGDRFNVQVASCPQDLMPGVARMNEFY